MSSPNDEEKRKRLQNLTNEVKDFHPLLETLLPKMPRVTEVENTHGNSEMGCDFLISRMDDTFGEVDRIGVVAKVGQMDQESITEIERQIDESFIKKRFNSGKNTEYVTEVWVMTTGSFTNNAKIKIEAKFQSKKIVFIPREKLLKLIDDHAPNFWTDVRLQIGQYLYELRRKTEEIEQSLSLLKDHKSIYIEQELYRTSEEKWKFKKPPKTKHDEVVDPIECLDNTSVVLVEGDMGAGKSKLLRRLVTHYTGAAVYLTKKIIPIPLSYKSLQDDFGGDFEKVFSYFLDSKIKEDWDTESKILFLVDGIDEKNTTLDVEIDTLCTAIETIKSRPDFKAVFASRNLNAVERQKERFQGVARLTLRPLSLQKLIKFIEEICSSVNIPKRIFEDLRKSPLFKQLPRTPIAAILLADLIKENSEDLPSNLPELYTKYLELMLGRWDMDKGLQSQKEYEALDNIMIQLSTFVIDNELTYISIPDVCEIANLYFSKRNLGIDKASFLEILFTRCGILTLDTGDNKLCFKHRTFAEYFYARGKLKSRDFLIDDRAFKLYWSNIFYFYVGILKDCPDVIDALIELAPKTEGAKAMRIFNMANFLLAGFATPYENIENGIRSVMVGAAEYYDEIQTGKIKSPLRSCSEMQLLWMFQLIVRNCYSYSFFLSAIENAALHIGTDPKLPDKIKAYALFFLNVTYIETGGKDGFDFILKDYAKLLPLSVQIGISTEAKKLDTKTALMKRQDKAIRNSLKNSRQMHALVGSMYERPLSHILGKSLKDN